MADFKPRAGGKPSFSGARGGKPSYGNKASFGGKPSFPKKNWADSRSGGDRPTTLHKANCSKCGNECEVPFRPVNGKPVFCRNCFVKTDDTRSKGRAGDKFPSREFTPRPTSAPQSSGADNGALIAMIKEVSTKLDRLSAAVEAFAAAQPKAPEKKEGLTEAVAAATKKPRKVAKK